MTDDNVTNYGNGGQGLLTSENTTSPEAVEVVSPRDEIRNSWKSYVCSSDMLEVMACALFLVAGLILESESISPRQRPIPFQQLQSTGEYIVDQVFNESFEGETVSSEWWEQQYLPNDCFLFSYQIFSFHTNWKAVELMLYGAVLPAVVQL
jgi:hypothetical protein